MSANRQQSNKDRTANFAKKETTKLMLLLKDYPVLTCKKTDHSSNVQKDAAWKSLCDVFNSDGLRHRSVKQLQQKYNNIKKTARKEMAAEKYGRRLTGGGPAPPKPSDTTEWLNSIMGESISGLPAVYDSDALDISNVEVKNITDSADVNIEFIQAETLDPCTSQSMPSIQNRDWEENCKENIPNNIEVPNNTFDSSTPKAMLRKPVSKELSVSYDKRKSYFNPLETRKRIITYTDKKINFLKQKEIRENDLSKYAKEEHEKHMLHEEEAHKKSMLYKKEAHQKAMQQMEERHKKYMEQQEELHQIEMECKKQHLENMKIK